MTNDCPTALTAHIRRTGQCGPPTGVPARDCSVLISPRERSLAAAFLEKRPVWFEGTLEAVYNGEMTLAMLPGGNLAAFPRGIAS
jgi:hypothetical protein